LVSLPKKIMKCLIISIFLLVFVVNFGFAQDKGMMKRPAKLSDVLPNEFVYRKGWVLAIGINQYPNLPSQFQLNYAVPDAEEIVDLLQQRFGYDKNHIILLKNEQATRQNIMEKLNSLADTRWVSEDDCMLFYYSGHGQTVTLPRGGDMGFLVPYDAKVDLSQEPNLAEYKQSCIAMSELHEAAKTIPARHRLFIIDACYSGLVLPGHKGLGTKIPGYLKKTAEAPTQEMITAGGKNQESEERSDLGHGVLTYKLLKGLDNGLADENDDGVITGSELSSYLGNAVMELTDGKQTPLFGKEDEGEFLFIQQEDKLNNIKFILSIKSEPKGASVSIDGAKKGVTPCTIEIDAKNKKQVTIYASKEGYKTTEKTFKLASGNEMDVSLQLQKILVSPPIPDNAPTNISTENRIIGKDNVLMVLIPAGEFVMGSNNSNVDYGMNKEHVVSVKAFYMDVYEVTNEQYRKFVEATGYAAPSCWNDSNLNEPKQPVIDITWDDAVAYCQWAGERLPTEAEWEKSAKGGLVGKLYTYGDEITHDKANYFGAEGKDTWSKPAPVGSFEPNGYGLYDMAGNVWEWCADWYSDSYYAQSPKDNPKGPDSGYARVLRGGAWNVAAEYLYVAKRYSRNPQTKYYKDNGFRCVKDVEN